MVRLGTPRLSLCAAIEFTEFKELTAGVGSWLIAIESLEVLEKDEGPPVLRLCLLTHLKMDDVQDSGPLEVLLPDRFLRSIEDCSFSSEAVGDFEREVLERRKRFIFGLRGTGGTGSSGFVVGKGVSRGMLVVLWKASSG